MALCVDCKVSEVDSHGQICNQCKTRADAKAAKRKQFAAYSKGGELIDVVESSSAVAASAYFRSIYSGSGICFTVREWKKQ